MKKAGVIFICIFYFFVASGLYINLHYCAGKLKGIALTETKEEGCCGSKKRSKGCCKEKTVVVKIKDNHKSGVKVLLPNNFSKDLFACFETNVENLQRPIIALFAVPESNAPPFPPADPVYLLNRNFRI